MQLKRQDIIDACGEVAFARGRDYFSKSRVLSLSAENGGPEEELKLIAQTKGSGRHTYEQRVVLFADKDFVDIEGYCTCPMHYNCKHIAAVCLTYQKNKAQLNPAPSSGTPAIDESQLNADVTEWLTALEASSSRFDTETKIENPSFAVYILKQKDTQWKYLKRDILIEIRITHARKNGIGLVKGKLTSPEELCSTYYHYNANIQPVDRDIGQFLKGLQPNISSFRPEISLEGLSGSSTLNLMIETGRCYWNDTQGGPLSHGDPRVVETSWSTTAEDNLLLTLSNTEDVILIPTTPPMYLDKNHLRVGVLQTEEWTHEQLATLLLAPPIPKKHAALLNNVLLDSFPHLPLPPPVPVEIKHNAGDVLSPLITLSATSQFSTVQHCLFLRFDYGGDKVMPLPKESITRLSSGKKRIHIARNLEKEGRVVKRLYDLGFDVVSPSQQSQQHRQPLCFIPQSPPSTPEHIQTWVDFLSHGQHELEADGWEVTQAEDFTLTVDDADWEGFIEDIDDLDEENGRSGNDWFNLRFDLIVNGERLPLGPLITPILSIEADHLAETLTLPLGNNRYVRIPTERILPFVETLRELFNRLPSSNSKEKLTLSKYDALAIEELGSRIRGGNSIKATAKQLKDFSGIETVAIPQSVTAELRPYQKTGLNWLQFLASYGFNGILADDMGLGKTVQTLVHLLVEKHANRLTAPALIIAPTSLMGNWKREIEKFTPELKVIVLHGGDRHSKFEEITNYDIVLSTYPLLARDADLLTAIHYHIVILDEAQMIKNPRTKMAKIARRLRTNHRLCLSGTPLENHLGELWALFDFLMPGFLGTHDQFTRFFRTPIEKNGDVERKNILSRRIQPFLLRRAKSAVATELPPKTEILRSVKLEPEQAELYESIRISMDQRVRQAITAQGFARSHITILDALLKLRQVCCDPRLLSLERAANVHHSAKLEMLLELLHEQLEEGRRILVFSQFTSMLALIENELSERQIGYSKLTGKTTNRDEAIRRFQEGEVDLFLISLKAGGTGLNLTEADTVVIYDPWWNPAVENQAIDRAHRIGQDKPVFIYKLVVENSVEEKMLEMQDKKRLLAADIYSEANEAPSLLNSDSLVDLFSPL